MLFLYFVYEKNKLRIIRFRFAKWKLIRLVGGGVARGEGGGARVGRGERCSSGARASVLSECCVVCSLQCR